MGYKAKVIEVNGEQWSLRAHYVRWNSTRYVKVVPLSSLRIIGWQAGGESSGLYN